MKRSEQIVELMDDVKKIISQMAVVDVCEEEKPVEVGKTIMTSCRFSEKKEKDREEFYFTKERCCRGFIYTCIYIICFDIGSCGFFSGL